MHTPSAGARLALLAGAVLACQTLLAAPAAPEARIEAGAERALQSMSDYLKAAKSYSFHADIQYDDVLPSGQKIAFSATSEISLRRPNGLHAVQVSDTGAKRLWFDGKELTLLDPVNRTYAVDAVSGNTDQALDHMIQTLHFTPPLSDFLYEDPAKALSRNTLVGFWVGHSPVDGIGCEHYAFVDKLIDWQIWVEDGKLPLPRKILITYKTLPSSPQFVATLSDWDFTTRLPDTLFKPDIPPGAVKIPFMKESQSVPAPVRAPTPQRGQ